MTVTSGNTRVPKPRMHLGGGDRTKALPEGALACRSCGVAVKNPDAARVLRLRPMGVLSGTPAIVMNTQPGTEIEVALCNECAERRALAESLVDEYRLGRIYGHPATDLLDAAFCALDVLRLRGTKAAAQASTRVESRRLIEALAHLGSAATWAARFAPVITSNPDECAPRRWAHVTSGMERETFDAFRALLRRQLEAPFPFTPPAAEGALPGCGICGVGTLRVKESDAADAWGNSYKMNPGVLGGRARPEPVTFHLCPTCRAVASEVGALGMGVVERAILRHLGYTTIPGWRLNFRDLRAWAALKPGTEPNATPWAHVNTEGMSASLARTLGARPLRPEEVR